MNFWEANEKVNQCNREVSALFAAGKPDLAMEKVAEYRRLIVERDEIHAEEGRRRERAIAGMLAS